MNGKLIFGLSLFGLAMGFATVFVIPWKEEPFFWLPIFIICAFVIARQAPGRVFLHGFLLGIVNSVWVTGAHLLFFSRYLAGHPMEAAMITAVHGTRLLASAAMVPVGLSSGLISGAVIGLLAYVVAKAIKSGERSASRKPRGARAGS